MSRTLLEVLLLIINKNGYIVRGNGVSKGREWWSVKCKKEDVFGIELPLIIFPKHLAGRKIRFKVEILPEEIKKTESFFEKKYKMER
jgi:hypothetical protein